MKGTPGTLVSGRETAVGPIDGEYQSVDAVMRR
jgi:hypothetical protein